MTARLAKLLAVALFTALWASAQAGSLKVELYKTGLEGRGEKLGEVTVSESPYGLVFTPALANLPPGMHGFHIHTNPQCGPGPDAATGETIPGGAAGGHYDPHKTGRHGMPWEDNAHLGDLPPLYVDSSGKAAVPVLAPRLKKLDEIRGRSLMIHEGGDNFSDQPKANGGGGGRIACGMIE